MRFTEQLAAAWQRNNSLLCVGLDPDPARLPASLTTSGGAIFSFCRAIVDATADLVCAFKPQIAYFASQRAEDQLEQLIAYIHEAYPGIPSSSTPSAATSAPPPSTMPRKPSSATRRTPSQSAPTWASTRCSRTWCIPTRA